jgi:hypothetical protein
MIGVLISVNVKDVIGVAHVSNAHNIVSRNQPSD